MPEQPSPSMPAHEPGTRKGEELTKEEGHQSGRQDTGATGTGRPTGKSTGSDFTGINPKDREPRDPKSPTIPPP